MVSGHSPRHLGELFAQLAEEYIDDLELRLVYSAIEAVKKHFLSEDGTLAQAEELEDASASTLTRTLTSSRRRPLGTSSPDRPVAGRQCWGR